MTPDIWALTLDHPWAWLLAYGQVRMHGFFFKPPEVKCWYAIHAAPRWTLAHDDTCNAPEVGQALAQTGIEDVNPLKNSIGFYIGFAYLNEIKPVQMPDPNKKAGSPGLLWMFSKTAPLKKPVAHFGEFEFGKVWKPKPILFQTEWPKEVQ